MEITSKDANRHSEEEFREKFSMYVDSAAGIIHVRTAEILRASIATRRQAILDNGIVQEWDIVNGFRTYSKDNFTNLLNAGDGNVDIHAAFLEPLEALRKPRSESSQYYIYICPQVFLSDNPMLTHLLLLYNHVLPATNIVMVLITPDTPLPADLNSTILSLHFAPPGLAELKDTLETIIFDTADGFVDGSLLTSDDINRVCCLGSGMPKTVFETYTSLAISKAGREGRRAIEVGDLSRGVAIGKTDIVRANDILELCEPTGIENVGGLENLKIWVEKRRNCYSDEAREFGISPPKGLVLVGVPGSGKSLTAKAIASAFGVPLVRLDFGRVFNSLVGESERRMRKALAMVESMAPVILFADEIDKGLGGIGSGGDSGISSRVLGSYLTWLNDCTAPVFNVITANNINGLPPEMLRKGRFDAIFYTSLPTPSERREVLRIHLALRGRDILSFPKADIAGLINLSDGYVPSEIEAAVKDGLVEAFNAGEELECKHIETALRGMVPLSKAFAEQIASMAAWAKTHATPASLEESSYAHNGVASRRLVSRSRVTRKD